MKENLLNQLCLDFGSKLNKKITFVKEQVGPNKEKKNYFFFLNEGIKTKFCFGEELLENLEINSPEYNELIELGYQYLNN